MPIKLIMVSMVVISVALFYKSSAMALAIPSYQSRDSLLPDFMDAEPALGLEDNNIDANRKSIQILLLYCTCFCLLYDLVFNIIRGILFKTISVSLVFRSNRH